MNTVLKSEKAELQREKKRQTKELRMDKLRNQHRNSRKNRNDGIDKESMDANSIKSRRSKLKKNFGEDWESEVEYGAKYQYISDSSMIDFGMLSETFNDENQSKLVDNSRRPKNKKGEKGNKNQGMKGAISSARSDRGRGAESVHCDNKGSSVRFAGALRKLNKPSSLHRANSNLNRQNQNSDEKQPKRSVMFRDLTDQRDQEEPKPSARSNSVASMGGILKNRNHGGNLSFAPQSAQQIRNKKKGMKRELSKQSLHDAYTLNKLQSSIGRGPSDSDSNQTLSEESRSLYVINQAKKAAELAVQNRELNKQMSKQRAEEYRKKEKLKSQKKKKIAGSSKSREQSQASQKQDDSGGNWFTNMFLFCGTTSCCTSKATQNQQKKTDMKNEEMSPQRSQADQEYQSLNGSVNNKRDRLSRHTAQAKLNKHDTSQMHDEKKSKKERYTQQAQASKDRKKNKRGEMISEKDLIFSNSDREEPQNLDMKKMKKQRKMELESAKNNGQHADKKIEKENQKNEINKKKSKKNNVDAEGAVIPGANGKIREKGKNKSKDKGKEGNGGAINLSQADAAAIAAARKPPIQKKKKQKAQPIENNNPGESQQQQPPVQEKKQKLAKNNSDKQIDSKGPQDQDAAVPEKKPRKKSESKTRKLKDAAADNFTPTPGGNK